MAVVTVFYSSSRCYNMHFAILPPHKHVLVRASKLGTDEMIVWA